MLQTEYKQAYLMFTTLQTHVNKDFSLFVDTCTLLNVVVFYLCAKAPVLETLMRQIRQTINTAHATGVHSAHVTC